MYLRSVDRVENISPEVFKKNYYSTLKPLVITGMAKKWPAYHKWNWDFFKAVIGNQEIGIYNNSKSDAYTPVNTADDYMKFGEYIDMIRQGPAEWRIFLFNIFEHAPSILTDFCWPEHFSRGFVKKYPMLFTGGQGSVTHMHFDIDLSHIFHTQFIGKKRILLFPYEEQHKLYRKPWEVLSMVNFEKFYDAENNKIDYDRFPALRLAKGYELILDHGETLFMPGGYWHHMEYIDSGFAMSLRAVQPGIHGKIRGAWNLFAMRHLDTIMKKTVPGWWYNYKREKTFADAKKELMIYD
ncbi:MAG TPA: cupin-like domain-containing protein [Puia sp.]